MSEQNENFLQRHQTEELEYNLRLVDGLNEAVQELRHIVASCSKLKDDGTGIRGRAARYMDMPTRRLIRDTEESVWNITYDIISKLNACAALPDLTK